MIYNLRVLIDNCLAFCIIPLLLGLADHRSRGNGVAPYMDNITKFGMTPVAVT